MVITRFLRRLWRILDERGPRAALRRKPAQETAKWWFCLSPDQIRAYQRTLERKFQNAEVRSVYIGEHFVPVVVWEGLPEPIGWLLIDPPSILRRGAQPDGSE